jgi:hypothetical protein
MQILAYTAINPQRRFPQAEQTIEQLTGVTQLYDFTQEKELPWYADVLRKYKWARWATLNGNYDALLTVESDMLVPCDAALRLSKLDAPVAYGLYVWRHGVALWNSYVALNEDAGVSLSDNLAMQNAPMEWAAAQQGKPFQCYGVGFGCTLIRRHVLEQIDFRNFEDAESFYCDWLFAADCNRLKLNQMCDPAVVCGHYSDSGVLYPDITKPELYRQEG